MAKRRGNNEGSIYKRANGSYRAQVTLKDGHRLSYNAKTRGECQEWIRQTLDQARAGLTYEGANMMLEQFLEEWLDVKRTSLQPHTVQQYDQIVRDHILGQIGHIPIREIHPQVIQGLYGRLISSGVGTRTVQKVHGILRNAFNLAVKLGLSTFNPVTLTTPPKHKKREMQVLDETHSQQLLLTIRYSKDHNYALYHLALTTGMRQGELIGLKWEDIDWTNGVLHVRRQLVRCRGGGFRFDEPKTSAGKRALSLGKTIIAILKEHAKQQFQLRDNAGDRWTDHDLVFTTTVGTPMDHTKLLKDFKKHLQQAGLPDIRFHDLRHTAASLMLNSGIPMIVVAKRLGHSKPSTTMDIYGHFIPSMQKEVADKLDDLITPLVVHQPSQIAPKLHQALPQPPTKAPIVGNMTGIPPQVWHPRRESNPQPKD